MRPDPSTRAGTVCGLRLLPAWWQRLFRTPPADIPPDAVDCEHCGQATILPLCPTCVAQLGGEGG